MLEENEGFWFPDQKISTNWVVGKQTKFANFWLFLAK